MKNYNLLKTIVLTVFFLVINNHLKAQCQSGFTYTDAGNGTINFNNTSTGGTTYYWNFDDGTDTVDFSPQHVFTQGAYLVCLTIDDSVTACTSTFCDSVVISSSPGPCTLNASYTYVTDSAGTYTFTANVTGGAAPYAYEWYFDDQTANSYGQVATHTYALDGNYYVCLNVTDSSGCVTSGCDSLVINGVSSCNIASGFTYTDNGGGNYSFTSTATGNVAMHLWSFGNSSSSLLTPSYSFPMDGTYLVSLYVADSNNFCNDYYTEYITVSGVVSPVECNASFTIYTDSIYNGVYVVNTSGGNNLSYFWDFGDGNTSTLAYPNYTYGNNGPYQLCLTVASDSGCTSTYCDSIASGGVVNKGGFEITVLAPLTTSVINEGQLNNGVTIYPNPVKDYVSVKNNNLKQTIEQVRIYDVNGKEVLREKNTIKINVSSLKKGIYFMKLTTNGSEQLHYQLIKY